MVHLGEIAYLNMTTSWEELTHLKRPWCWERLKAGGEGDNRGWDGWMASPTQWTWVWVSSGSWWWTGKPGMLQFMGSQRLDTTEWLNWTELNIPSHTFILILQILKELIFTQLFNLIYIGTPNMCSQFNPNL